MHRLQRQLSHSDPCAYSFTQPETCYLSLTQVRQVTAKELEEAIPARRVPLIIDFYATWCGPCVLLAKELESVCYCGFQQPVIANQTRAFMLWL